MEETDNFKVVATTEISRQQVQDLLITAINDRACYYWLKFDPESLAAQKRINNKENTYEIVLSGGAIKVYDAENPTDYLGLLCLENISAALNYMANFKDKKGKNIPKRHWHNLIQDNADAETADVFLQLAVMGEIVFG